MTPTAEPTDNEKRAVEIVFERETGQATRYADIPTDQQARIRDKIEKRLETIEHHVTHDMLIGKLSEGRRFPRRHQQVVFVGGIVIFVGILIVSGVVDFIQHAIGAIFHH